MADKFLRRHKTSVWIVDDNVNFCIVLAEAINRTPTMCCEQYYGDIKTAKNALQQSSKSPFIILLDINMPHISGLDGITILKNICPEMHIVMLTSYENENEIKTALQRGASGYFQKHHPARTSYSPLNALR
jgi:DNA-binding NarL/FixJ family response regulator